MTSPGQGTPAERGQGTGAGSDPVAGALGISAPTPAAQLLDSAGNQLAEPGEQSVPASGPEPGGTGQPGNGPGPRSGSGRWPHRNDTETRTRSRPRSRPTKPTDKPTDKPSEEPSPSEPPGPRADVSVTAGQESESGGRARVWAQGERGAQRQERQAHRDSQHRVLRRPVVGLPAVGPRIRLHRHPLAHRVRLRRQRELPAHGDLQGDCSRPATPTPSPGNNSASVQVSGGRGSSG